MVNMSAKFDEESHNGLVYIVFTSSTHEHKDTRTDARNHRTTQNV